MARSTSGQSVLERTVSIFEAFDPDHSVLTISELARRTGLPTSTTSRLVAQLQELGLLSRDSSRRVRLGLRLWELASRASSSLALREVAMPFIEDLQSIVGHHTQLGVREGLEELFIERVSARGAVVNMTKIAGRLPLHASSGGLVLLAHAPSELQDRVLSGPLPARTAATITDPATLRRVLADVRQQGFAFCPGHIDLAATGISVPVHDARGAVRAALGVVVPNNPDAQTFVGAVRVTARGLERALRGAGGESVTLP